MSFVILNGVQLQLYSKDILTQGFFCEFCEFSRTSFVQNTFERLLLCLIKHSCFWIQIQHNKAILIKHYHFLWIQIQ